MGWEMPESFEDVVEKVREYVTAESDERSKKSELATYIFMVQQKCPQFLYHPKMKDNNALQVVATEAATANKRDLLPVINFAQDAMRSQSAVLTTANSSADLEEFLTSTQVVTEYDLMALATAKKFDAEKLKSLIRYGMTESGRYQTFLRKCERVTEALGNNRMQKTFVGLYTEIGKTAKRATQSSDTFFAVPTPLNASMLDRTLTPGLDDRRQMVATNNQFISPIRPSRSQTNLRASLRASSAAVDASVADFIVTTDGKRVAVRSSAFQISPKVPGEKAPAEVIKARILIGTVNTYKASQIDPATKGITAAQIAAATEILQKWSEYSTITQACAKATLNNTITDELADQQAAARIAWQQYLKDLRAKAAVANIPPPPCSPLKPAVGQATSSPATSSNNIPPPPLSPAAASSSSSMAPLVALPIPTEQSAASAVVSQRDVKLAPAPTSALAPALPSASSVDRPVVAMPVPTSETRDDAGGEIIRLLNENGEANDASRIEKKSNCCC